MSQPFRGLWHLQAAGVGGEPWLMKPSISASSAALAGLRVGARCLLNGLAGRDVGWKVGLTVASE